MQILNELTYINNSSLALGFFDGLHQGHMVVLKNALNVAKKYNSPSVAVIFRKHPQNILSRNKIEQILTNDEKLQMLEKMGFDYVVMLNFEDFQYMSAKEYLENILIKYFSPVSITTGFNHFFGYNRQGDSEFLRENSKLYNYEYYEIPPYVINGITVSSSQIRNKLQLSDFQTANEMLGYKYFIQGIVEKGEQLASRLGFPSANITYPLNKVKVPYGVYFVNVELKNRVYNGVFNYGLVKGSDGVTKLKTEVHILDFSENIYGKNIKISFVAKIRNQMEFDNIEKLKYQIRRDIAFVEIYKHFLGTSFSIPSNKF